MPRKSAVAQGKRAARAGQRELDLATGEYQLPPLDILSLPSRVTTETKIDEEALEQNARLLETVLDDFGVKGQIVKVRPGPVVTLYELEPAPGTKSSRVIGLADDIARSMSAVSARVATVPGRNVIGIELPNARRETVFLRELLSTRHYEDSRLGLPLALGKDIGGDPVIADLARMPHLLIGGTTGSGKSVAVNTMILSLLYRLPPDRCRFIMIDPKMLELSVYEDIPHLLTPVVTEPRKAIVALKWVVREMEDRYRAMSALGVRNIAGYNERLVEAARKGQALTRQVQTGIDPETRRPIFEDEEIDLTPLPFIVVIIDEMADLMLVAGKEIEAAVQRLAQMARAAGIHVIMATQRPSVDVITGTIKANFPTRISFQVTSKIDSRTILGEQGGEQLLGQGDMLYMAGGGKIARVHGPFVTDGEVEEVVRHLRAQGEPAYIESVTDDPDAEEGGLGLPGEGGEDGESDQLYDQAIALVARERKCSHQLHPALPADRLQPRRPHRRAHGARGRGQPGQPCRQARGAGARHRRSRALRSSAADCKVPSFSDRALRTGGGDYRAGVNHLTENRARSRRDIFRLAAGGALAAGLPGCALPERGPPVPTRPDQRRDGARRSQRAVLPAQGDRSHGSGIRGRHGPSEFAPAVCARLPTCRSCSFSPCRAAARTALSARDCCAAGARRARARPSTS